MEVIKSNHLYPSIGFAISRSI